MSTKSSQDIVANDRELIRTAAIGLGVWLTLTLLAVALLLLFGEPLGALFV